MNITEILSTLQELQTVLSKKFKLQKEMKELPHTLTAKKEMLVRLKEDFLQKNQRYEQVKSKVKELREQLAEAEQKRAELEARMEFLQTQREFEAQDKEIRMAAEKEQQIRRDLQREESRMEEIKQELERERLLIEEQEKEISKEEEAIQSSLQEKMKVLEELKREEEKIGPLLDPDMVFKFSRIIQSKEGVGIVPVIKDVCQGCFMLLPREFVNRIRRGEEIIFCPHCSRILFFQEVPEEVPQVEEEEEESFGELSDLVDEDELFEDDLIDDEDSIDFLGEEEEEGETIAPSTLLKHKEAPEEEIEEDLDEEDLDHPLEEEDIDIEDEVDELEEEEEEEEIDEDIDEYDED
ncbi:protein of unknown function DUF164 [Spirochaeta thermophila DSM 6578]|uniref:C4-type zinc ribbon domain-containing protein n=2 Tax=Winmispira thermophila TaxID=154 RepID=G0GDN6_WINT7|nr:protein of unknown function DUF164 [Spirochaeta thermophila DSM 6578]